jgi:hypothetical protein
MKNEHGDVYSCRRQRDVASFIQNATFHSNGEFILMCRFEKRHLFDMKTGIRQAKDKNSSFRSLVIHNRFNENFYSFERVSSNLYLIDFTIKDMKNSKQNEQDANEAIYKSPIEKMREDYLKGHEITPVRNVI